MTRKLRETLICNGEEDVLEILEHIRVNKSRGQDGTYLRKQMEAMEEVSGLGQILLTAHEVEVTRFHVSATCFREKPWSSDYCLSK